VYCIFTKLQEENVNRVTVPQSKADPSVVPLEPQSVPASSWAQADATHPSAPSQSPSGPSSWPPQEHLSVSLAQKFSSHRNIKANLLAAVIAADRASSAYDIEHTPQKKQAVEREREREALLESNKTAVQRAKEWATENRYPLLFGFWVASMAGSWSLVNRNRYLSGSQKLVQARMYAQGATLAALMTSFALEGADAAKGQGRWETIKVLDPNDPEHKQLIEKRVHHESYPGEDQWRGMCMLFSEEDIRLTCA
jgi:hypothetical protein